MTSFGTAKGSWKVREVLALAASSVQLYAVAATAGNMANRKNITIQNLGPNPIYLGPSAAEATVANGYVLPSQGVVSFDWGPELSVWAIAGTANQLAGAGTRIVEAQ
jgi:hypothetical protein